jgi:hypothetical protein
MPSLDNHTSSLSSQDNFQVVFLLTHIRFSLSFSIGILIKPISAPSQKGKKQNKRKKDLKSGLQTYFTCKNKRRQLDVINQRMHCNRKKLRCEKQWHVMDLRIRSILFIEK